MPANLLLLVVVWQCCYCTPTTTSSSSSSRRRRNRWTFGGCCQSPASRSCQGSTRSRHGGGSGREDREREFGDGRWVDEWLTVSFKFWYNDVVARAVVLLTTSSRTS